MAEANQTGERMNKITMSLMVLFVSVISGCATFTPTEAEKEQTNSAFLKMGAQNPSMMKLSGSEFGNL